MITVKPFFIVLVKKPLTLLLFQSFSVSEQFFTLLFLLRVAINFYTQITKYIRANTGYREHVSKTYII